MRSSLAIQVLGLMKAAGIDAFIANTTTELAMCNLVGIPTVSLPIGYEPVSPAGTANTSRREPLTVGLFGWPNGEPEVNPSAEMQSFQGQEMPPVELILDLERYWQEMDT